MSGKPSASRASGKPSASRASGKPSASRVSGGVSKPSKKPKDASDGQRYQGNITALEELLIKSQTLAPTLRGRPGVSGTKNINFNTSSSDGFYMITIDNTHDCHAILIYKQMQPNGSVQFYIYDPNGKEKIKYKNRIMIDGKRATQIDVTMTPDGSVNPEGFCALWSILVMILWDMNTNPVDPFEDRMHRLNLFNEKIYGPRKIPGLRKWFITTIYYLFMKRRAYIPSVTEDFVRDVEEQIRLFFTYSPASPIFPVVDAIAEAIDAEKAGRITEEQYDTMVNNLVKESISAGAGAGAGAGAVINAAVAAGMDIAAKASGAAGADADADGGGIRRVRSLRHKNKMSRRAKKMRRTRRTRQTRRTRRTRQTRRTRRKIKYRNR